jgi:O-antigen/teichoic acid export membrane protein
MWGVPFGVALSVFAADLVDHVLGSGWEDAVVLLQVFGVVAALNHIGFNWSAFYRARGDTRPIAIVNVIVLAAFLAVPVPLLFAEGLSGFAAGIAVMAAVSVAARFYFLAKLFPGLQIARHMMRAIAPTLPAVAAVLGMRLAIGGDHGLELALLELGVYLVVTVVATLALERRLLREVGSYLRPAGAGAV